jgi:hypothetical protein
MLRIRCVRAAACPTAHAKAKWGEKRRRLGWADQPRTDRRAQPGGGRQRRRQADPTRAVSEADPSATSSSSLPLPPSLHCLLSLLPLRCSSLFCSRAASKHGLTPVWREEMPQLRQVDTRSLRRLVTEGDARKGRKACGPQQQPSSVRDALSAALGGVTGRVAVVGPDHCAAALPSRNATAGSFGKNKKVQRINQAWHSMWQLNDEDCIGGSSRAMSAGLCAYPLLLVPSLGFCREICHAHCTPLAFCKALCGRATTLLQGQRTALGKTRALALCSNRHCPSLLHPGGIASRPVGPISKLQFGL